MVQLKLRKCTKADLGNRILQHLLGSDALYGAKSTPKPGVIFRNRSCLFRYTFSRFLYRRFSMLRSC